MAYDIGPRIGIEGEKEFRDAISKINTNLRTLDTEMEKVVSEFDKGDKSVAALSSRNEVLNKQIDEQKKKLSDLQKYLDAAKTKYGENSAETQRLQQATNKATAELNNMERELRDNNTAIESASKSTDELGEKQTILGKKSGGLGDALDTLAGKIGINLPSGVKDGLNSFTDLDTGMAGIITTAALVATAVYKVIDALADLTIAQAGTADDLLTNSIVSGIDAKTLQELKYAAGLVDTEVDTITGSMTKLTRTMDSARSGTKETADAYRQLGIKITEGPHKSLRDSETVFWETIDALRRVRNETERDALAMTLMGKSAKDLNPLIEAGSGKMKEYAKQAHETGYVLNDEMLETLGALDDQMMYFNNSTETAKNMVAVEFAPALTKFMEVGGEVFEALGKFAKESGLVDVFASILEIVSSLGPAFETLSGIIGPMIGQVLKPLSLALAVVADALNIIVSLIAIVVEGIKMLFGTGTEANVRRYWGNVTGVFTGDGATARTFNNLYGVGHNADGTDNWSGGWTWVGERGPELIKLPQSTQIFSAEESASITGNMAAMAMMGGSAGAMQSRNSYSYGGDTNNITLTMDEYWFGRVSRLLNQADSARQDWRAGRR